MTRQANVDNHKLDVLIDADNMPASRCGELLAEVSTFGLASVKQADDDRSDCG